MAKLNKIETENISYANFRKWLDDIARTKETLLAKEERRLVIQREAQALRSKVSELEAQAYKLKQEEEEIRQELINVIPKPF